MGKLNQEYLFNLQSYAVLPPLIVSYAQHLYGLTCYRFPFALHY